MDQHFHHAELLEGFSKAQKDVFESSEQAMYAYLDDDCRFCNDIFAKLLGYSSADEWRKVDVKGMFPGLFVDEKSQQTLVSSYQQAMEKRKASSFEVAWKKKSGGTVLTQVILVPVAYEDHLFALHFVE